MPTGSVTITAKSGPNIQNTNIPLIGITAYTIDLRRMVIQLYQGNELTEPMKEYDLTGITTITDTISGGNHTLIIS